MSVPVSAFASLALACNHGLDRDEMSGFTYQDAVTAIEAGAIVEWLRQNLTAEVTLSAVLPWQDEVDEKLREYLAGYGREVSEHARAENKGLCLVLGLAIELMLMKNERIL